MQVREDDLEKFFLGLRTERVKFCVNDHVRVTAGPHKGKEGAVVVLNQTDPITAYVVELATGFDIDVNESELALLESRLQSE